MTKMNFLSGSWLKVIAMISMLVDHSAMILMAKSASSQIPYFSIGKYAVTDYFICRNIIGRLAFPIFAFLLVEGYKYTKSRKRYFLNLLIFAFISIIPWNLIYGGLFHFSSFNVLFTLFFGVLGMMMIDKIVEELKTKQRLPLLPSMTFAFGLLAIRFLHLDYGIVGVAYIITLHLLQGNILGQFAATIATFTYNRFHQFNFLAYIPIFLYNGKRGFIKGKWGKYTMYAFYPIHLFILWWITKS